MVPDRARRWDRAQAGLRLWGGIAYHGNNEKKGGVAVPERKLAVGEGQREAAARGSLRLTRALAQDLRASLHGLAMALEMAGGNTLPEPAGRYVRMARAEAAQLDRTVEQLGLWIRLLTGDYRPRPRLVDLADLVQERIPCVARLPQGRVMVLADKDLLGPALEGLRDLLRAYTLPGQDAAIEVDASGRLTVSGPLSLLPVLETVAADVVPDLGSAKGPAMWLVGPALAVAGCRACGGSVALQQEDGNCCLSLQWPRP